MKIAIGLPHLTSKYDARFGDCLADLLVKSAEVGHELKTFATYRDNVTFARNKIASQAYIWGCDYLLFLDDDMVFQNDLLIELLKHDAPVVGGLTFIRSMPHEPSMYILNNDDRTYNSIFLWKPRELIKVDALGMAATLIKRSTLEVLIPTSEFHNDIYGFFDNLYFLGEDFRFCRKVRDLNLDIFCDTSLLVGHITDQIIGYTDYLALTDEKIYQIKKKQEEIKYGK